LARLYLMGEKKWYLNCDRLKVITKIIIRRRNSEEGSRESTTSLIFKAAFKIATGRNPLAELYAVAGDFPRRAKRSRNLAKCHQIDNDTLATSLCRFSDSHLSQLYAQAVPRSTGTRCCYPNGYRQGKIPLLPVGDAKHWTVTQRDLMRDQEIIGSVRITRVSGCQALSENAFRPTTLHWCV